MNSLSLDRASRSNSQISPAEPLDDTLSPAQIRQQAIALVLKNIHLTTPTLKALSGASSDTREVVSNSARILSISQKQAFTDLRKYSNLKSLICEGDHPTTFESSPSDLHTLRSYNSDPVWIRIAVRISNFFIPLQLAAFKAKRLMYRLEGGRVQDAELHHLRALTNLEQLYLKNLRFVTDRGLSEIGQLSQLKHLGFSNCPNILGKGICQMDQLLQLESLKLVGQCPARLRESGALDTLTNLPALQDVQFGPIYPRQLSSLVAHELSQKVKTIEIRRPDLTVIENLVNLPNLENLTFSSFDPDYSATEIARQIGQLPQLRSLKFLTGGYWRDAVGVLLDAAANLPNLTALHLHQLESKDLTKLKLLTQLQSLTLSNAPSRFTDDLSSWPQLKYLDLTRCVVHHVLGWQSTSLLETLKITESRFLSLLAITTLRDLPELKSLDLNNATLPGNFSLHHLADLEQLQDLDLSNHRLDTRFSLPRQPEFRLPVPLPNLTRLSLKGCALSREKFEFIAGLPKLEEIDLTRAQFDEQDLENLKTERPQLRIQRSEPEPTVERGFWKRALTTAVSVAKWWWRSLKSYLLDVVTLRG